MRTPDEIAEALGIDLFDYQRGYWTELMGLPVPEQVRTCLYYRTGAGKSITALAGLRLLEYDEAMVVAPPSTHLQWSELGMRLGMTVSCISHAKFRMRSTRLDRYMPVIADEFHMFGGQQGQGWRKLDALARGLRAPMVLLSATPNYNDVERVYCVARILDPQGSAGGYLQFLYTHCHTRQNPFSQTPDVTSLRNYPDAATFLADLPKVFYVPDEAVYDIVDIPYQVDLPVEMERYGLDMREHRIFASQIERAHTVRKFGLIDGAGMIRNDVMLRILDLLGGPGGVLVYANHATVANALSRSLTRRRTEHAIVTGATTKARKEEILGLMLSGQARILLGTASLATGTDGLDRVCDRLVILDDTDDDALRRQLLGRLLPRGSATMGGKEFFRFVPSF